MGSRSRRRPRRGTAQAWPFRQGRPLARSRGARPLGRPSAMAERQRDRPEPRGIDALLDVWPIFEALPLTYVSKGLLSWEQGKKRPPRPRPEWTFGGGDSPTGAWRKPARMPGRGLKPSGNAGRVWQVEDLVAVSAARLRCYRARVIGWDMSARCWRSVTHSACRRSS